MNGDIIKHMIKKAAPYIAVGIYYGIKLVPLFKDNSQLNAKEVYNEMEEDVKKRLRRCSDEEIANMAKNGDKYAMIEAKHRNIKY